MAKKFQELRDKLFAKLQAKCTHMNLPPFEHVPCIAWHKMPDEWIVGICFHCQKRFTQDDPEYHVWLERSSDRSSLSRAVRPRMMSENGVEMPLTEAEKRNSSELAGDQFNTLDGTDVQYAKAALANRVFPMDIPVYNRTEFGAVLQLLRSIRIHKIHPSEIVVSVKVRSKQA